MQYASINGNGFGGYGETVLRHRGHADPGDARRRRCSSRTHDTKSKTQVVPAKSGAQEGDRRAGGRRGRRSPSRPPSARWRRLPAERGYAEELEHWAWCIRNPAPENQPHCHPKVAMGDAVIALTTNMAAREGARIEFKEEWFDIERRDAGNETRT